MSYGSSIEKYELEIKSELTDILDGTFTLAIAEVLIEKFASFLPEAIDKLIPQFIGRDVVLLAGKTTGLIQVEYKFCLLVLHEDGASIELKLNSHGVWVTFGIGRLRQ